MSLSVVLVLLYWSCADVRVQAEVDVMLQLVYPLDRSVVCELWYHMDQDFLVPRGSTFSQATNDQL